MDARHPSVSSTVSSPDGKEEEEEVPDPQLRFVFGDGVVQPQTRRLLPEDGEQQELPGSFSKETLHLCRTQLKRVTESILRTRPLKVSPLWLQAMSSPRHLLLLTARCVIFSIYILKATRYPISQIQCSPSCQTCCGWTSGITTLHPSRPKLARTGRLLVELLFEIQRLIESTHLCSAE